MAESVVDVWLVEDNEAFRRSVARAVNRIEGLRCAGDFRSLEEALPKLEQGERPQVMLLDINLPGIDGIAGLAEIHRLSPDTKVIILTVFDDQDRVFRAICAGAAGYLLKTSSLESIGEAIHEVVAGGAPINPRIARRVLDVFARISPPAHDYGLTSREREILERVTQGASKKEIAAQLALSYHTVDSHLRSIYHKLHVNTRAGAVAKALKERLV